MINLIRTLYIIAGITGSILILIGTFLISLLIVPTSSSAKALNASNNKVLFIVLGVILMGLGLLNLILFIKISYIVHNESFMIGPNKLTTEQYDNEKLMTTQGRLQESREMLASPGYPFTGLEEHETHLKENFIAQNLPLWTEK
jgi:hypothetical protein